MKFRLNLIFVFILIGSASGWAQKNPQNYVSDFFDLADKQLETRHQCVEVRQTLIDILNDSPQLLKAKRYRDYQNHPNRWTFADVLGHYFVSVKMARPDENSFLRDYKSYPAKKSIVKVLQSLGDCSTYGRNSASKEDAL